jgi:hypothetical protein
MVRVKGKSVPTQSIRIGPNKMIEVDAKGDLEPLKFGDPVQEANQLFAMSQQRVDSVSGANPITSQGNAGSAGHSNLARSSFGASLLGQGASNIISDCIDKLANQVLVPYLYDMQEMNAQMLPYSQLDWIMSEELKHDYVTQGGDLIEILNAKVKFSVLAGSKMHVRRNMSQSLPLLTQNLANPAVTEQLGLQGMKVDWLEISRMWFMAGEWANMNDVIVPMSDEEKQQHQAKSQNSAQAQKFQAQQALLAQKSAAAEQLADSQNVARAARDCLREGFKKAVEPEMLTGQPQTSGAGFGGNL